MYARARYSMLLVNGSGPSSLRVPVRAAALVSGSRVLTERRSMPNFNAVHRTELPRAVWLWGTVLVYAAGRVCQIGAGRLPVILIVVLHVVPPAVFALVHG